MIQNTVYLNEESERKQLTMPFWAYEFLKSDDGESMSKGVKAYEALLFAFDEYEDSLTDIESNIDDQLESFASHSLFTAVQKIKNEKHSLENADFDSEERADRINIHLPVSLTEQLTVKWGIGDHIAEAIYEVEESAYADRLDRINCKREIVNYLQDKRTAVDHPVAQAVIDGDSDVYDVDEAHAELQYITDDEWYLADSVTVDQIEDRGSEISDKDRSGKIQALETAVENSDEELDEEELVQLAKKAFDVEDSTAAGYVDDIDVDTITSNLVYVDTQKLRQRVVDVEDYFKTEYSSDPTGYLGLDDDDLVDGLMDGKDAIQYLKTLQSRMSLDDIDDETRRKRIDEFTNYLEVAIRVLKGIESGTYVEQQGVINLNPE